MSLGHGCGQIDPAGTGVRLLAEASFLDLATGLLQPIRSSKSPSGLLWQFSSLEGVMAGCFTVFWQGRATVRIEVRGRGWVLPPEVLHLSRDVRVSTNSVIVR
jgi:hypothetical protein